ASADGTAAVWAVSTWKRLATVTHGNSVTAARFSADSTRIITASIDRTARVWNARSGRPMSPPLVHSSRVLDAAFNAFGDWAATASEDGVARIWNTAASAVPPASQVLAELTAPGEEFRAVEFSSDGLHLLTRHDVSARIWNLTALAGVARGGRSVSYVVLRHPQPVTSAAFDGAGQQVITASLDGVA